MRTSQRHYIGGEWVVSEGARNFTVISPWTEQPIGTIALGSAADVEKAANAARKAFPSFSQISVADRIDLLEAAKDAYKARRNELVDAITEEMGSPRKLSQDLHALMGHIHLKTAIEILKEYPFRQQRGDLLIEQVPIGVCAMITPWNWPVNQIASKVVPALACGCTMVLKPSEYSPFSATIWAEVMQAAGVPSGVFNMVLGTGPEVGAALTGHPEVDMVSFTGSTRAGVHVAQNAAPTIKRVHQELGGKSANIILPDADLDRAVAAGSRAVFANSGQSCNAPTRMLVPMDKMDEACRIAAAVAENLVLGGPEEAEMGPLVSQIQFEKVQELIQSGIDEGAELITGGPGRPDGLSKGYFVQPTVFGRVQNNMRIAREEIFGPALSILGYSSIEEAIEIANDSPYGIAGYVSGKDKQTIEQVVAGLRAGQVIVNHATPNPMAPFGGFKKSGNGREWGEHAFEAFLETKAVLGSPRLAA